MGAIRALQSFQMAIPSNEEAKPRLQLFPVVALLAGLVLVAAVCVLATADQTPKSHSGAVNEMLFQTQMLKGSDAEKMRASIFKELEKAMSDIRTKLTKQEAKQDSKMTDKYKENIKKEKDKIEKF